ncbi:MAG: hypothetical protein F7C34_04335 [Desulfurococcales archaeon]|nr:hypothetical protein [Desulfurococcales archaeon]
MKWPRWVVLAYLDFSDTLRPGIFDALVVTMSLVGVVLSYLEYFGSSPALAMSILSPTLLATALYLALRSSAGLAHMAEDRVIDVYLSYPLGRSIVAGVLLVSRVLVPASLIILLPALAAGVVYSPLVGSEALHYLEMIGAFIVQAVFYGLMFSVIALFARRGSAASIISLLTYFVYNILGVILSNLAESPESLMYKLSRSMSFYLVVYQRLTGVSIASPPGTLELCFVPCLSLALAAGFIAYFRGWYEP